MVGRQATAPVGAGPRAVRLHPKPLTGTGRARPTPQQRRWLLKGLDQAGGKLPLFDQYGQQISERTIRSCIEKGWAEPWFVNPTKPDWLVCKLTAAGRAVLFGRS